MPHPTLEDAIAFAAEKHGAEPKPDKAGQPYILHPLRVMLDPSLRTDEERITAVLHDIMEDCGVTAEQLRQKLIVGL
jgi:(p)ppGpp synthase/HD superfamily hydrolase